MAISRIDQMLIYAAKAGDNDKVNEALNNGADIHADNDRALRWAIIKGHKNTVALLLDRGVDISAEDNPALRLAVIYDNRNTVFLLLRRGANPMIVNPGCKSIVMDSNFVRWVSELKPDVLSHFNTEKPSGEQCIAAGKLDDKVIDACVTGQFTTLIGAPLVASTDKADRKLFQDIWEKLPEHWQDQNQNIYMQFIKEGGVTPILGPHTGVAQSDFPPSNSRVGR